jgi:hypothetical protein
MTPAPAQPDTAAGTTDTEAHAARQWRRWLAAFLLTTGLLGTLVYAGVVLVDPFATGRFTLMQGIDVASRNARLLKGGVARDAQFDAAVFGSSTGYPLDPQRIGDGTGWTTAQLAIPAGLPPNQLLVARTFQRYHSGRTTLQIYTLDELWCRPGDPAANPWGAFPDWVYESTDVEYLSRILFPEAVTAAARRLAIRAGLMQPPARADGFMPTNLTPVPKTKLAALVRPSANPAPDNRFPALELLAAHVAGLPAEVRLAFVFTPPYVNMLPANGSPAEARLQACKARAREIVGLRPDTAWLDLMTENAITTNVQNYFDEVHTMPAAADAVAAAIIDVLKEKNLVKR